MQGTFKDIRLSCAAKMSGTSPFRPPRNFPLFWVLVSLMISSTVGANLPELLSSVVIRKHYLSQRLQTSYRALLEPLAFKPQRSRVHATFSVAATTSRVQSQTATRASDFLDSVGVVTHFNYTDTAYYQQPDRIIALLQSAGIRHVRDGLLWGWVAPNLPGIHDKLAAAGIGANLVMPNPDPAGSTSAAALIAAVARHKDVDALEAPNEWDQAGGSTWASTMRAYLPILQGVARTVNVPLYGPSLTSDASYPALGNIGQYMDYNSEHNYWGGRNPESNGWGGPDSNTPPHYYGSLDYDFDKSAIIGPGTPIVQTETGYAVNNTVSQNIISEATEAVYEPRLLLHSWNKGIKRTYIYELMEDPSSTAGIGLLRSDMTPRPAFTAISSLMSLLADSSGSFPLQTLNYTLTGNTTGVETTLLQKKDGSFWLALWLNGSIWDVNAVKAEKKTEQDVTLTVSGRHLVKNIYQFTSSGRATPIGKAGAAISFSVGGPLVVVAIR